MALYNREACEAIEASEGFGVGTGMADEPATEYEPTREDYQEMEAWFDDCAFDRIIDRYWAEAQAKADTYGPDMAGENRRRFVETWIVTRLKLRAEAAVVARAAAEG